MSGLNRALLEYFGEEFTELSNETELVHEEPRTLAEVLEAEREYFDKVWYVRNLVLEEKIEAGEHEPFSPEQSDRVHAAMRAVEERYGREHVGPWDDWGWGFVNGKLSALRWGTWQRVGLPGHIILYESHGGHTPVTSSAHGRRILTSPELLAEFSFTRENEDSRAADGQQSEGPL